MDQEKIGKFIAVLRKEKGYTQSQLAEKFNITDRAVSKWETGKCMPDTSIMAELCDILGISINELLCGERLDTDKYKAMAEENLLQLQKQEESSNKKLLSLEVVIGVIATVAFMAMVFAAGYAVESHLWQIIMIAVGVIILSVGCYFALKIEREAGYYQCPNCQKRYVPSMKAVVWAPHIFRSRRLKCPYCNKSGYHKKVLKK